MDLKLLEVMFNRAMGQVFCRRKLLVAFVAMVACGFVVVFCRGLGLGLGPWLTMSLGFFAFFLCSTLLLCLGILLIRHYREELAEYQSVFRQAVGLLQGTSYLAVPVILAFVVMWIALGLFNLLGSIPGVGGLLGALLAFGPFLIVLCTLLLCAVNCFLLFFVAPAIAMRHEGRLHLARMTIRRLLFSPFANILLALVGLLPLALVVGLEVLAMRLAGAGQGQASSSAEVVLTWFAVMLPFSALTAPAVVFFFHFAAEAHLQISRESAA